MKICSKCGQQKELNEFHKEKGGKFGVRKDCKMCNRARTRAYYRKHANKYIKRAAIHNATEKGRTVKLACDRKIYARNKQNQEWLKKERARSAEWKRNNRVSERARWAAYNAAKLKATPSWADLSKIKEIYLNCPKGYEVDHIIPLQGRNVCGFHVEYNLQYLTRSDNARKGNKLE